MPRTLEQKNRIQNATTKYLILREALRIEGDSEGILEKIYEDKAVEIVNELERLHLDYFVKENPWSLFGIFNFDEQEERKNRIKSELKNKKSQLDFLSPEEKEDLKKSFFDDKLRNKLIAENNIENEFAQTAVADEVHKIYEDIENISAIVGNFRDNIEKIANKAFAKIDAIAELKESFLDDFKDATNDAFEIASKALKSSSTYVGTVNFISNEVDKIFKDTESDDLKKLNELRQKFNQNTEEIKDLAIRQEFEEISRRFVGENKADRESVRKFSIVGGEFFCSLLKKNKKTQDVDQEKSSLNIASIFVGKVARNSINYGCKTSTNADLEKYYKQVGSLAPKALESVKNFGRENAELTKLISEEEEFFGPVINIVASVTKTATALGFGVVESIIGNKQQDKIPNKEATMQKRRAQEATLRYLILKEALENKEGDEEVADKIFNELQQFYFEKEILRSHSEQEFKDKIVEEFKCKKEQLSVLLEKDQSALRDLFFDDKLKDKLMAEIAKNNQEESTQNPIADTLYEIYKNIEKSSESLASFKDCVEKNADDFKLLNIEGLMEIKEALHEAFEISAEAIRQKAEGCGVVNCINGEIDKIIEKSSDPKFLKSDKARDEYNEFEITKNDDSKSDEMPLIRRYFLHAKSADGDYKESIKIFSLIQSAYKCSSQEKNILSEEGGQTFERQHKSLEIASSFVANVAEDYAKHVKKLFTFGDSFDNSDEIKKSTNLALEDISKLHQNCKMLRDLTGRENENFLNPITNALSFMANSATALASGLIEPIIGNSKQQNEEVFESTTAGAEEQSKSAPSVENLILQSFENLQNWVGNFGRASEAVGAK